MARHAFDKTGEIWQYKGGYAMHFIDGMYHLRMCCLGHPTPEEAKEHGLVRMSELASEIADRDIRLWHAKAAS